MNQKKEYLHCWVNDAGELQIEIDDPNPRVKAALCLPLDDETFLKLVKTYLWMLEGNDDDTNFPGRMIELFMEDEE